MRWGWGMNPLAEMVYGDDPDVQNNDAYPIDPFEDTQRSVML